MFHGHFLRVMAEILLAPEPNYKLKSGVPNESAPQNIRSSG